jgi:hypothetical protein
MSPSGELLELDQPSGLSSMPTPWSLGVDRLVGTLSESGDGDCGGAGISCSFECESTSGSWGSGTSHPCGGNAKNTFKIVGNQLFLATSSPAALDYESYVGNVIPVRVRVVVQDSEVPPGILSSTGTLLDVPIANVNEAPTDVTFSQVCCGDLEEAHATPKKIGELATSDPDGNGQFLGVGDFTYTLGGAAGDVEFEIKNVNEIWTTNILTNFEPPGPAYSFTVSVVDAGSLPVPGQSLVRSFTVVVTDKIEAPSASGATFTVDENSAAGAFVANYGSPAYVTLGDAELTFDIVDGNTARHANSGAPGFQFSALQTDGGGVAIVTLTTADAAATDPVRAGDKIEIRKIGQQRFDTTGDPTAIDADGFMVIRLLAVPADWEEGQVVHLELIETGCGMCSAENTRIMNGPKLLFAPNAVDRTIKVKSFGVPSGSSWKDGTVWRVGPQDKTVNGVFTVTSVEASPTVSSERQKKIKFSVDAGLESKAWGSGAVFVQAFDLEDCSGILTVASDAIDFETKGTYTLRVQVRTDSTINEATVSVVVGNIDEAPYYDAAPASNRVDECFGKAATACSAGTFEIVLDSPTSKYFANDPEGQNDFTLEVLDDAGNRDGNGIKAWTTTNPPDATNVARKLQLLPGALLDFEKKSTYALQIVAKDNDDPVNLRIIIPLTVIVNDKNEPPEFASVFFIVKEDASIGYAVNAVSMSVFDPEGESTTLEIFWALTTTETNKHSLANKGLFVDCTSSPSSCPFKWKGAASTGRNDLASGKILEVQTQLNYEYIAKYTLVLNACDIGGLCTCTTATSADCTHIDVIVEDVNEAPAWKASKSYVFYTNEDDPEGKLLLSNNPGSPGSPGAVEVGSLSGYVDDPDAGSSFTFVIHPDPDGAGTGAGGWLTTEVTLTSELGKPLRVNVPAAVLAGTEPNFESLKDSVSAYPRLVSNGKTPADGALSSNSGSPQYSFNVQVIDNGGISASSLQTIKVIVLDANEAPSFDQSTRQIEENSPVGSATYTEGATSDNEYALDDDDVYPGGQTVTYTLNSGNTNDAFKLVKRGQNMQLQVKTANLNYEGTAGTSYFLSITVRDNADGGPFDTTYSPGSNLTDTATVTVNLLDINDAPVLPDADVSIFEDATHGDCVQPTYLAASDEDRPKTELTYSLAVKATSASAGDGSVFEAVPRVATDTGGIRRETSICIRSTANLGSKAQLSTNSMYTTTNGAGSCNCEYQFTLTVDDNAPDVSYVDPGDGSIKTKTVRLTASAIITLRIGDVNAEPAFAPTNVCTLERSIKENILPGNFGAALVAQDPDTGVGGDRLTFSLVSGGATDAFGLSSTAPTSFGAVSYQAFVKNNAPLDFEAGQNTHTLRVRVQDSKTVPSVIECDVIVTVTNVNEAPTSTIVPFPSGTSLSVKENAFMGTMVGRVISSDPDVWQDLDWSMPTAGNLNPNPFVVGSHRADLADISVDKGVPSDDCYQVCLDNDASLSSAICDDSSTSFEAPPLTDALSDDYDGTFVQKVRECTSGSEDYMTIKVTTAVSLTAEAIRIVASLAGDSPEVDPFGLEIECDGCDMYKIPPVGESNPPHYAAVCGSSSTEGSENCGFEFSPWELDKAHSATPRTFVLSGCAVDPARSPTTSYIIKIRKPPLGLRIHDVKILSTARVGVVYVSGAAPIDYESLSATGHEMTLLVKVTDVGGGDGEGLSASGTVKVAVTNEHEGPVAPVSENAFDLFENTNSDTASPHVIGLVGTTDSDASGTAGHTYALHAPILGGASASSCWRHVTGFNHGFSSVPGLQFDVQAECKFSALFTVETLTDVELRVRNTAAGSASEFFRLAIHGDSMSAFVGVDGTQAQAINQKLSPPESLLAVHTCTHKSQACGSGWTALSASRISSVDMCAELCRTATAGCKYFQFAKYRTKSASSGPNCWKVPNDRGAACLSGTPSSTTRDLDLRPFDADFCRITPRDSASFWVSTTSTAMLGGKCSGTTTLSAGSGILVGANTYLTITITSPLVLPSWAEDYDLQLSSNTGGRAVFSPICFSSTVSPQPSVFFRRRLCGTNHRRAVLRHDRSEQRSGL